MNQNFHTEAGLFVNGLDCSAWKQLLSHLQNDFQYNFSQIVEAAAYSYAMVIRVALGFSASDAKALCLCRDNLAGWVALSCARQLQNAGTECDIVLEPSESELSAEAKRLLRFFEATGSSISVIASNDFSELKADRIQSYHLALSGLVDFNIKDYAGYSDLIEICNEFQLPVHSVFAPLGIDLETGERQGVPLIASSTLSLGIPLACLVAANEYVGRHYICDISVPSMLYDKYIQLSESLFSSQPVVQLFVPKSDEDEEVDSE